MVAPQGTPQKLRPRGQGTPQGDAQRTRAASPELSTRAARTASRGASWPLSLTLIIALLVSLASLSSLFSEQGWWFSAALLCVVVLGLPALVRAYTRSPLFPLLASLGGLLVTVTLLFSGGQALLGIIPTPETFEVFSRLVAEGSRSISTQSVPAATTDGITFLVVTSAGLTAAAAEVLSFALRKPVLSGVLFFGILVVPGFIREGLTSSLFFVLTALAYLAVLVVASTRGQWASALRIATAAIAAALLLPVVLPPVDVFRGADPGAGSDTYTTGINPFLELGEALRRDDPVVAMTYTTSSRSEQYFTLATLDDFAEQSWRPSRFDPRPGATLAEIDPALGRGDDVVVDVATTDITIGRINGRWLPMPYAPISVAGVNESWFWEPETLSVRSSNANMSGQTYEVTSEAARPTVVQLRAADPAVPEDLERFLVVPDALPPSVAELAATVTAGAETNYDKAVLLQSFFRTSGFVYSEEAPVEEGYDGSGVEVIERFLEARSGYCVHFSSAMAAMARTLDIPARIAVGFTSGSRGAREAGEAPVYTVTTDNLHAWPELYFAGVGWTRFEPTIGTGSVPAFPSGATPVVPGETETTAPESTPSAAPSSAPNVDNLPPEDDVPAETNSGTPVAVIVLAIVALLLLLALSPAVIRILRRASRLRAVATTGAAAPGWRELRETVDDLGWRTSEAMTPRDFGEELSRSLRPNVSADTIDALDRLRSAVETETFARDAAPSMRVADVRAVLTAVRALAPRSGRVLAALWPSTELHRWRSLLGLVSREKN